MMIPPGGSVGFAWLRSDLRSVIVEVRSPFFFPTDSPVAGGRSAGPVQILVRWTDPVALTTEACDLFLPAVSAGFIRTCDDDSFRFWCELCWLDAGLLANDVSDECEE